MLSEKGVKIEQLGEITGNIPGNNDEVKKYKDEIKILNKKLFDLSTELKTKNHKLNEIQIQLLKTRREKDILELNFDQIIKENPYLMQSEMIMSLKEKFEQNSRDKISVLDKYMKQVQFLQHKLVEKETLYNQTQIQYNNLLDSSKKDEKILIKKNNILHQLGKENYRLKKQMARMIKLAEHSEDIA